MSNDMKLIMESWRTNQLLLESDEKKVLDFLKNVSSGNLPPEEAQKVFKKLGQNKEFKQLTQFFSEIEDIPIEEGPIDDAMASLSVKGMTLIDALKSKPGGQQLINAGPALMAMAYAAAKLSQGELNPEDLENVVNLIKNGSKTNLIDLAATGG
jgi:hypothetical protein